MLLKPSVLALAQVDCVLGDVKRNVESHAEIADRARAQGAQCVIFPELSLTGYSLRDLNFDVAFNRHSEALSPLLKQSKDITIVCGGVEEDDQGAVYNAAFVLEDGEVKGIHRKIYLPTYGMFEEGRYFTRGHELQSIETRRLGRIGVLVCEDLWHPILPYVLARQGAQLLVTIAASPTRLDTGEEALTAHEPQNFLSNREHHATYARLFGTYLAFVNRVGVEDGVNFWGGSELMSPFGEAITIAKFFEPDLCFAPVDPGLVRQSRQLSRHFLDEDPHLTRQLISRLVDPNGE